MSTQKIKDLAQRLDDANVAYRTDAPIMSDAAFDKLEDGLRALDPNHPMLAMIGAPAPTTSGFANVAHSIAMGSLKKCHFDPKTKTLVDRTTGIQWWPNRITTTSLKNDGISLDMVYVNRNLAQAITRGDGIEGEDILRNVLLMEGAVKVLPPSAPANAYVRAEIICRKSKFKAHFPGGSNPRNTAGGTARRQSDNAKCRYLTVMAYQWLPDGVPLASKWEEFKALEKMGFVTTPHYRTETLEKAVALYHEYVGGKRDACDVEIDGLVLDVDDRDQREALGVTNMRPGGSRALKFPHAQKPTILRGIRWQVGKSGRLTPVADFDVVNLAGAQVRKASLHNIGYMEEIAGRAGQQVLCIGDEILVSRRGDVIPYVEEVLTPTDDPKAEVLRVPEVCPMCGTAVVRNGAYLVCPNGDTCPAQISGAMKRWLAKIGVKFFGDALIDLLCETGTVERIADLYWLDPDKVAAMEFSNCRKVGGVAAKAFRNLHAATTLPLHVFVGSLGIPLIGRSMAKTIADAGYGSLKAMSEASIADVATIPGVGPTKAAAFVDGFWDLLDRGIITSLRAHITIAEKATGAFSDKSVCMTGFRDAQMVTAIENQGGTVKSSVSKGLDILVIKDPLSTSGKAAKARKYGTELVGIDEMWDRLGGRP